MDVIAGDLPEGDFKREHPDFDPKVLFSWWENRPDEVADLPLAQSSVNGGGGGGGGGDVDGAGARDQLGFLGLVWYFFRPS